MTTSLQLGIKMLCEHVLQQLDKPSNDAESRYGGEAGDDGGSYRKSDNCSTITESSTSSTVPIDSESMKSISSGSAVSDSDIFIQKLNDYTLYGRTLELLESYSRTFPLSAEAKEDEDEDEISVQNVLDDN